MKNKIMKSCLLVFLSLSCMGAFMMGSTVIANAGKSNIPKLGKVSPSGVTLTLGKADMVSIKGEVADVLVANPSIVDVMAVKSNRLYLVGSSIGDTNIMALDADGNILRKLNVHVKMDTDKLQSTLYELYPNEAIKVKSLGDQIVLTGEVSNPSTANKVTNLVGKYLAGSSGASLEQTDNMIVNMLGVRGEQQVMLKVKIVEVSRSAVKNLGLNLEALGASGVDGSGSVDITQGLGLSAPQQFANAMLSYNSGTFGNLNFIAQALEQEGIINTLAEPNLTAISGEQAGFLAGGEFPIPTQIDRNGNLIYEFKPFGVSLNFKPQVMSKDRISMQLTTEVSTTSFEQNLQLNGINIPTFNVRRAETNVELPSGGTLMIAGLIQSDAISSLTQIPGVKDVPVMGDLLKSDSFQRSESEVLVMVTPYLVQPFADRQQVANAAPIPAMQPNNQTSMTHIGPDMNYSAIIPEGGSLPRTPVERDVVTMAMPANPAPSVSREALRTDTEITEFFSDNIRRIYGHEAPADLLAGTSGFGYVLE